MTLLRSSRAAEITARFPDLSAVLLALYLACCAITTGVVLWPGTPRFSVYSYGSVVGVSDLILVAVILTQIPALPTLWADRSRHRCAFGAAVLAVSLIPALAAHPSTTGVAAEFRWVGVAMFAFGAGRLIGRGRYIVVGAFAGATTVHLLVAVAQRAANGRLGLGALGEQESVAEIGGRYASSGLTSHPYVLAAWCVLAGAVLAAAVGRTQRPARMLVGTAVLSFVGVGLTMSRAGALAAVLVLACLAAASIRQPRLRVILAGAVLATALGVALDLSGWTNRASSSSDAASAAELTNNRTELLQQAWYLWKDSPVVGVGPSLYLDALVKRPDIVELSSDPPPKPVHAVPALLLVEGGVVVLPALLLICWAVATQAWRGGILGLGVALAVVPFLLLDKLNWVSVQGLCLSAAWLGALDYLAASGEQAIGPRQSDVYGEHQADQE